MKTFKKFFLLSAVLTATALTGCAFAPLNNITTARTATKGHVDLAAGAVLAQTPRVAINYGLTDDIDMGIIYEAMASGFLLKWAPINNQQSGISLALLGSYGTTMGGTYWFAGPVVSAKVGFWEPYLIARYNSCSFSSGTSSFTLFGSTVSPVGTSYSYTYFTVGSMFWFTNGFGLALEDNFFGSFNNLTLTNTSSSGIYGISLVFKI